MVCGGEVGELFEPGGIWGLPLGLHCGTSARKDLFMVPGPSCHIYGIWTSRTKKVWWMLNSHQLGVAMQVTKGGLFSYRKGRFSLCNTVVLWNFIARLTGTIKYFIGDLFSLHYCCFTCLRLVKPKVQLKVPK